jgi:NADH-quinone oxidoreductase subunit G
MCYEGRFGFHYIHGEDRLTLPLRRQGSETVSNDWDEVLTSVRGALARAAAKRPSGLGAILSPWMTLEEAYLAAKHLKGLSPDARLALGPVRVVGQDDRYPKDVRGRAVEPAKFVIRAEKCPNRLGVEAILRHFEGRVVGFEEMLGRIGSGEIESLYLVGGDPEPWIAAEQAAGLSQLTLLIVQDILPSPASAAAHFVLPGGSFAEREGTLVNHSGLAQAINRAIAPPEDAWPDGRILWQLAGRRGLFHAPTLRQEMAQEVSALAALAGGELGEWGIPGVGRSRCCPTRVDEFQSRRDDRM